VKCAHGAALEKRAAQVWRISLLFAVKKQPNDKPLPQQSKHWPPVNEITAKNLLRPGCFRFLLPMSMNG
jgi:hypothetical protein